MKLDRQKIEDTLPIPKNKNDLYDIEVLNA